jgi:hypothetical protein
VTPRRLTTCVLSWGQAALLAPGLRVAIEFGRRDDRLKQGCLCPRQEAPDPAPGIPE